MELLDDRTLRADIVQRTSIVRGVMFKASHTILRYNWYAAGYVAGAMPSRNEMIQYGTVAALAYYDEGDTFSSSLKRGVKMMSAMAYNEGKGVVTRAKAMQEDGNAYAPGSTPFAATKMAEKSYEDTFGFELIDELESLPLDPQEVEALTMRAYDYTPAEIARECGKGTLESACEKAREALGT